MSRACRRLPLSLCVIFLPAASSCGSEFTNETPEPPDDTVAVALETVASGLAFPLDLTAPPGDPRLFVVEKGGAIRVIRDGALLPTPFLDLTGRVSTGDEQGLLGLAFAPDYATSGRFVVHFTDPDGHTRVSSFAVSGDPDVADPASESPILTVGQPFPNHNGGRIAFGPDGYLYVALGDGGGGGDPDDRGQSLDDLLGSLLRLDLAGGTPYAVPPDNPFVGVADARPEVWAYGLRNPWRFSFDRATGDLYIADVGQSQWEEINYAAAGDGAGRGVNYGWRRMEGRHCFASEACDQSGLTLPAVEYDHGRGCSVTGGYVYRGAAIPELQGHYFYADYCQGWVRSFRVEAGAVLDEAEWPTLHPGSGIPSLGEDAAGELYILTLSGDVFRIVPG